MNKDIKDPRPSFIANVKLNETRVKSSNTPIVLLCGGRVDYLASEYEKRDLVVYSLRHIITHKLHKTPAKFELFHPESITTWMEDGLFPDLVVYEQELAAICTSVVLVLESPGTIAELGAFSQNKELRSKLLVIKSSQFSTQKEKNSFINHGILKHLTNGDEVSKVEEYPWNVANPKSIKNEVVEDIIDSIEEYLVNFEGSERLNTSKSSHITAFICELISIFVALKQNEIFRYLDLLGFSVDKATLQRKLYLLEKFKIIIKHDYGGSVFYLERDTEFQTISFRYKETRYSPQAMKLMCQQHYEESKDKNRLGAIREVKRIV